MRYLSSNTRSTPFPQITGELRHPYKLLFARNQKTTTIGKLEEGDKIEADYLGKGRYYPGKISRDRRDGTYDVDYDDGEKETRVDEKLIRLVGGSPKKVTKFTDDVSTLGHVTQGNNG